MRHFFVIGAFLVIMGVIFTVLGFKEKGLAAASTKEPEQISLKNLIARGPDGNPNILLTDHVLCDNFVFRERHGVWSGAWVPMVPRESVAPGQVTGGRPAVVQAIMFTIKAKNQADLYQRCGQQGVRALVTNRIVNLGRDERELLQQQYPGTDFDRCLIVQEGREPASAAKYMAMIGGGIAATVIGLGLLGFGLYRWQAERTAAPRKKRRRPRDEEDEDDDEEPRPIRRSRSREAEERTRPSRRRVEADEEEEEERPRRGTRRVERDDEDEDRPRRPRRRQRDDDD